MTPRIFGYLAIALGILGGLGIGGIFHLLTEYVLPSDRHAGFGALSNVPRRHLESLRSWEKRTVAALNAVHAANDAFIAEAHRLGRWRETSARGGVWELPCQHIASLALVRAKYPDGPPLDELCQLAGIDAPESVRAVPSVEFHATPVANSEVA
jgi:hypothetical protein